MANIDLAIFIITYNHENYINAAIDGVLKQSTDFNIKLFIGDDASTDGTRNIIEKYAADYPNLIELILHPSNIGAVQNAKSVFEACLASGAKYIALCEGDDYWTDPMKLQKQFYLLESNPQYSLCFHEAWLLMEISSEMQTYAEYKQDTYSTVDVLKNGAFVPTLSIVFRTKGFYFTEWHFRISIGDIALVLMNSLHGDIVLIREKMGVYRKHNKGMSVQMEVNQIQLALESVKLLHYFNLHTDFVFDEFIQKANVDRLCHLKHFVQYKNTRDTRPLMRKIWAPDFWLRKITEVTARWSNNNK